MPCCGQPGAPSKRRGETRPREHVDPTRALFAGAKPQYEVVPHSQARTSKKFSTLQAAQDYARRTGGILRST